MKLIALDLDNTLLNDDHQISPLTLQALRQAATQGIQIVLATGKTRYSSGELITQLRLNTPGVYLQGLVLVNKDGSINKQLLLPEEIAREALETAVELNIPFTAYNDMDVYALEYSEWTTITCKYGEPEPQVFDNLDQMFTQKPIQKIIFANPSDKLDQLRPVLAERFNGRASLVRSQDWALEVIPLGTSKGGGLKIVLDQMGIDPADIIAFGDGENDLEMIQMAGIGVAMSNAMPVLKEAADFITLSNNQDGIPHALKHFGIIE